MRPSPWFTAPSWGRGRRGRARCASQTRWRGLRTPVAARAAVERRRRRSVAGSERRREARRARERGRKWMRRPGGTARASPLSPRRAGKAPATRASPPVSASARSAWRAVAGEGGDGGRWEWAGPARPRRQVRLCPFFFFPFFLLTDGEKNYLEQPNHFGKMLSLALNILCSLWHCHNYFLEASGLHL